MTASILDRYLSWMSPTFPGETNPQLHDVHERELTRGSRNRATLAVARKLVAYLRAVDTSGRAFVPRVAAEA